ncbi:ABC transporter permease subunit [Anaerocolumna sedimenticola]|uniref:ABC transporter permease subunit n=1 Tax=Anaerocolumna sedimenticola TaxID=2696063 RepID=A0A6P1THL6_9FIRM|nr:sugar ABC transporter permease [Anaerocolumna sedimenticola]QHQ59426.1 ABC transporter permease subunit [Anaerocolumna sedimenticola]
MNKDNKSAFRKFIYKEKTVGYVFALPFIIGFLGFTLIPIISSLYYSFTDYNLIKKESWIGLSNYGRLFQDERFWMSLKVTMKYVLISVPSKLCFALLVAIVLIRKSKLTGFYRSLFYVPSLIGGSIAVALVWKELFSRNGLINQMIGIVDIKPISWFGDQKMAIIPLILMTVWQFGSSMIIFAAGLKEIPTTYYEAAKIDGANRLKSFLHITIPVLSPVILYNLIMQTISAFMSFTQAFVITKGGPNDATNFYALYMYDNAFKYYDMGYASAMSWVMLIIMSVITLVIFKTSKSWVFSEAGN